MAYTHGKLWGGRFSKDTAPEVEVFTASIVEDARLWRSDIRGSQAHAQMLGRIGVLTEQEALSLVSGLERVGEKIESGELTFRPDAEDVHSEIERFLNAEVGAVAGKLHTARSRNDQVVTATRLYLSGAVQSLIDELRAIQQVLVDRAEQSVDMILPGCTHLQHAQPVSLAHHLLAYFWMCERDVQRLDDQLPRILQLPLGSAALAGTSFPLDREGVARELGFSGVCENSLDAVSDRDFVVEFLASASLIQMHLSRLSEELILWSTPEYGYIELDDSVTTGSSIMPQKKNPDVAELIRGKTGRVFGALSGALVMLKGLPLSYNRDLQEDKEHLFKGFDTVIASVRLMRLMLETVVFKTERMEQALAGDFSNATDLADALVRQGLPFREAHEVSGRVVKACLESGRRLEDLSIAELREFVPGSTEELRTALQFRSVMEARTSRGGTSPKAVREQIARAWGLLA